MTGLEVGVIVGLVTRVFADLDTVIQRESELAWNVEEKQGRLKDLVSAIQAVLRDASEQQIHNHAMTDWLQKLKRAADDANDFLRSRGHRDQGGVTGQQVRKFLSFPFKFRSDNVSANEIEKIIEKFEWIANERRFHLNVGGNNNNPNKKEETDSSRPQFQVFEREEAKEKIVKLVININSSSSSEEVELSVIPIAGIRGIGKTTLAQLVYNDGDVEDHFRNNNGLRMWVWVSDNFDVNTLSQKIIQSATSDNPPNCEHLSSEHTQQLLQKTLGGKRFLLVLDNVCNEVDGWDRLVGWLKCCGNHGSRVIVTTSNKRVAEKMGTTSSFDLEGLSELACWSIFKQNAFKGGRDGCSSTEFEEIGMEISRKSRGVPLAAQALGSLMLHKTGLSEWLNVQKTEFWNLSEKETKILPALRSSCKHLLPWEMDCFTYCSVFPRGFEIEKEKLVSLWIANGFIPESENRTTLEEVGRELFKHFLSRFFFQGVKRDYYGNVTTFKVHGLMYDLARSEMGTKCSIIEAGQAVGFSNRVLHLCCDVRTLLEAERNFPSLKSLVLLRNTRGIEDNKFPPCNFNKFKYLQVLDLSFTEIAMLPKESKLENLRYLDLTGTNIKTLPQVLCQVKNLQTLVLTRCSMLTKWPVGMRKMRSLRHLDITECPSLPQMPDRMGKLSCLRTLPLFIVGENRRCGIGELQMLNLQGELNIRCLENVASKEDAEKADLKNKEDIRSLGLSWKHLGNTKLKNVDQVLKELQPHKYLRRLSISEYTGEGFPSWIAGSSPLSYLVELRITGCRNCEHLPPLGELPLLKSLTIQGMDAVRNLGSKFYGSKNGQVFPSLEELTCTDMIGLEYWASKRGEVLFPRLTRLTIKNCPKLSNLPCLTNLNHMQLESPQKGVERKPNVLMHLEIMDCPSLKYKKELDHFHALKTLKTQCQALLSSPEGLRNLVSLESLEIDGCRRLESLPENGLQGLRSLQSLLIQRCHDLTSSQGLQHLTNLRLLKIIGCPNLVSLPEGLRNLTRLQALSIHHCDRLEFLPRGGPYLTRLEVLEISNCRNLKCLPKELMPQKMELKHLRICNCDGLTNLPELLGNVTSLRSLHISKCHSLEHIPAGLRHLTLESMIIQDCPVLEERLKRQRSTGQYNMPDSKRIAF